jgi:hypothetical protein
MSTAPHRAVPPRGLHLATVAHDGLLWDTYVDFDEDPRRPRSFRARLRFDVAGGDDTLSALTTVIIIEDSYEEAVAKARAMDDRVLTSLLRSALPDPPA